MSVVARILVALLLCCPLALAQKGTAGPGFYPGGYAGDTWTGVATSIDETTRQITITHVRDGELETFTGVIAPGYVARKGSLEAPQLELSKIVTGTRVRAYYFRDRTSTDLDRWRDLKGFPFQGAGTGTGKTFHLVFLLELLDDNGKATTGTVTATSEETREITLAVSKGGKTETFAGELIPGLHMRQPDGRMVELRVSQIPLGTAITVFHVGDRKKVTDKKVSYQLIYRIEPPRR